jgi:hypothetical protein
LFNNPNLIGSCIINILYTEKKKKKKKNNSGAKGLMLSVLNKEAARQQRVSVHPSVARHISAPFCAISRAHNAMALR